MQGQKLALLSHISRLVLFQRRLSSVGASSPADIFRSILSPSLVNDVLKRRSIEFNGFYRNKGQLRQSRVVLTTNEIYKYLAVRVLIQGTYSEHIRGPSGVSTPPGQAFARAQEKLAGWTSNMIGKNRESSHIHRHFFLSGGAQKMESTLNKQIQSLVNTTGEALAGDEKLFRYTGRSGLVRLCPNKPAKTGIWHCQLVCYLPSGLPVLISTKAGKRGCIPVYDEHAAGSRRLR